MARNIIPPTRIDGSTRAISLSATRMGKTELIRMRADNDREYLTLVVDRPHTRGDCINGPRPCPFVSCKEHLYLDVHPKRGSLKINFPDIEPHEMEETCTLDVADKGTELLDEVGKHMNLTRERVRQYQETARARLVDNGSADALLVFADYEAPRQLSPMGAGRDHAPHQRDIRSTRGRSKR